MANPTTTKPAVLGRLEALALKTRQVQAEQSLKQFKVRVRGDLLARLHQVAEANGLSTSALVTAVLEEAIAADK